MSFEDSLLVAVMAAAKGVGLEVILIGNAAAALHGVPLTTQDIDLFVHDTSRNRQRIEELVASLGPQVVASRPFEPVSPMIRIEGLGADIDIVFDLSSRKSFESVRSRATTIVIESVPILVCSLEDVIAAKKAADRPKDRAVLPLLEQYLRVKQAMNMNGKDSEIKDVGD